MYLGCPGFIFFILAIWCFPEVSLAQEWATNGSNIYNTNSGYVGIGETGPNQKLHVSGGNIKTEGSTSGGGEVHIYNTGGSGTVLTKLTSKSTGFGVYINSIERLTVSPGGYVGIGDTGPNQKLHVSGGNIKTEGSASGGGEVHIYNTGGSGTVLTKLTSRSTGFGVDVNSVERLTVTPGGYVGIGTTNPSAKLDVLGDATFSGTVTGGNIQAKYQDIAEWVYSPMAVVSGTVVVLDAQDINRVIPSSMSYDSRVAGVVSDTPGILLGESGDGKVKVATTGRVKVKADATHQPINVGDLLVTSDREGYAMRSEPLDFGGIPIHRPGTLIGKALEPLKEGQGEILVLLSLQ